MNCCELLPRRFARHFNVKFLVFQHIACEHPGIFRHMLDQANISWDAIELDEGQDIPPLEGYDALWVMGGPMDVWDEEACPWLVPEKVAIRRWVTEINKPYLGVCLGHQLLADALGGECAVQMYNNSLILRVCMTEKPFLHKKAFANVKLNFMFHDEVAKTLVKLLNKKRYLY